MSECYVNVEGGLGNQLFQIAAGYAYCKKYGYDLFIDTLRWTAHQGNHPGEYSNTIFKNFEYKVGLGTKNYNEKIPYEEIPYEDVPISINGYFQSMKYFEECVEDFKKELVLPEVNISFIKEKNVAFHIRRGDYLQFQHIYGIGDTYFKTQFEKFKDYQINVFTDSPEIVLKEFEQFDFNLIQSSSEIKDLTLIAHHDNVVCSNSSFSWWGSLLGKKKDKIVVPDKWINGQDCSDIYRSNMTIEQT